MFLLHSPKCHQQAISTTLFQKSRFRQNLRGSNDTHDRNKTGSCIAIFDVVDAICARRADATGEAYRESYNKSVKNCCVITCKPTTSSRKGTNKNYNVNYEV